MQISTEKLELVRYIIPRVGKSNGPLSKFGKEFHLFLIVVFSFSTTLCIFYHLWYCHFDPIINFTFVVTVTLSDHTNNTSE